MIKIDRHIIDEMLSILQSGTRFQVVKLRECYEIDKEAFRLLIVDNVYNRKEYLIINNVSEGKSVYYLRIKFDLTIEDIDQMISKTIHEITEHLIMLRDGTDVSINLKDLDSVSLRVLRSKLQNNTYRSIMEKGFKTIRELKHYCGLSSHNRYTLGTGVLLDLAYILATAGFEVEELTWLFTDTEKECNQYKNVTQPETTILSNEYGDLSILNKISDSYAIATFTKVDSSHVTSEILTDSTLINNWSKIVKSWGGYTNDNKDNKTLSTTSEIEDRSKAIVSDILSKGVDEYSYCLVKPVDDNATIFIYKDKESGERVTISVNGKQRIKDKMEEIINKGYKIRIYEQTKDLV